MKTPQSSSIEHSEKQPPCNSDLARQKDKLKLDTHDTLMSSNDPAGLFSDHLVSSIPSKSPIPAVDTYPILHNLHQANNCNNCKNLVTGKCKVHGYQMPYPEIDCEQWEYRGKKI